MNKSSPAQKLKSTGTIAISPTGTQNEYSVGPASNALHTSVHTFGVPYLVIL